uniref:FAD-binding protein n=1 Tax=Sandarakinorhabdus rubra TaxID=2672568 RepID=UPI0013DC6E13
MLLAPTTPDELAALVREAAARGQTLAVTGSGSKPGIGPGAADAVLDMTGIGGAIQHDPAELLLTAPASTPLADIAAQLAAAGQCLAFEPPASLWGAGGGT